VASDISLAVDDGARRMTYAELAEVRGISLSSARRLVLRHRWPRQRGNDGVVRVIVPLTALAKSAETAGFHVTATDPTTSHATDAVSPPAVTTTDPMTVIAIDILSQAVEMLREDLGIANRRIHELLVALSDASTAARISGNKAAGLRVRLQFADRATGVVVATVVPGMTLKELARNLCDVKKANGPAPGGSASACRGYTWV